MTIEQIYNEHYQAVFHHVISVIKNHHDSEEVANNVFIKMYRLESAHYSDKKETALASWIRTITNHQIVDYFRTNHQDRYKAISDFLDSEGNEMFAFIAPKQANADAEILSDELQQKILKAFRNLKFKYRRVATLFFIKGYEYSEIAEMLNIPMGSVKGMLSRARAMLQEGLKDVYTLRTLKAEAVEA